MIVRPSRLVLVAALCGLALASGCGGDSAPKPPESGPDYSGVVEEIDADGRVLIQKEGGECGVWFSETDDTEVLRRDGPSFEPASWSDLAVGTEAVAWVSGDAVASVVSQAGPMPARW